jgi:hypothetical protein
MKWINAGERMPVDGASVIFRRVGDKYNNSLILSGALSMKIYTVQQINLEKTGNHQLPFEIDMKKFEWLDESPASEEDIAFVIYNSKTKMFLDRGDYFTEQIKNAKTFTTKAEAEKSMKYYVKIYSQTNRKDTCDNLSVLPVEIQISIKE